METVVTARVPADEFALAATFAALPDAEIEAEPVVGENVMSIVRVRGASRDALDDALEADPSVDRAVRFGDRRDGDAHGYRIDWNDDAERVVRAFTAMDGVLLGVRGRCGEWRFRLRYPRRADLQKAHGGWVEAGITVDIERIHGVEARSFSAPET